jgi:hypothetical protein
MRHSEDPVVRAFLEGREIMPHEAKHEHTHERSNPAKIPS